MRDHNRPTTINAETAEHPEKTVVMPAACAGGRLEPSAMSDAVRTMIARWMVRFWDVIEVDTGRQSPRHDGHVQ